MSAPVRASLFASLTDDVKAGLGCPAWCTEPALHELADETVMAAGGINRIHYGRLVEVLPCTAESARPLQVQLQQWVAWDLDEGFRADPPSVHVLGMPEEWTGLRAHEAAALAEAVAEAAAELSAVTR